MKKNYYGFISFIGLILIWSILSLFANPLFIPSPIEVLSSGLELMKNNMLIPAIFSSLSRVILSSMISFLICFILGCICYMINPINQLLLPIVNCIKFIPITAFSPLLILWIGIGEGMKTCFLFCATFFYFLPVILNLFNETDKNIIETGLTLGMSKFQTLIEIIIPANMKNLISELISLFGICWTYIALVEAVNCSKGLGYFINIGSARGKTSMVFLSMIIIMLISFVTNKVGNKIINHYFPWKK